jgi:hypothetical protein
MISPLLGGPDRIVAIAHLDETPARTALFSRREIRRALDMLDAIDPEDQRVEIAILPYSAPILVARPHDPMGEGWVAVAGHTVTPDEEVNNSEIPKSSPVNVPEKPDSSTPAKKEENPDRFDTGFPAKPLKREEKPAPAKPAPEKKPATPTSKYTCEVCGAPISATQQQISQLFASRTLCKPCFDKLREASK